MEQQLNPQVKVVLNEIRNQINKLYGYHEGIPRINYGPCGVFAQIFYNKWNELFNQKAHICFILTLAKDECDHIVIRLPSNELYDGGIGLHSEDIYLPKFIIEDMLNYDDKLLEKWSYGLERVYPRFCPDFSRTDVEKIVSSKLENLHKLIGSEL